MSEIPGIPEDQIDHKGLLARFIGRVLGKKSAGGATPKIENLQQTAKTFQGEELDQLITAAAKSQREEYQCQGLAAPDDKSETG